MAIGIAAFFSSCTKDGATGPTGPQGPAGNANVQQYTYIITSGSWSKVSATQWSYNTTLGVPTTDVADVYFSENGASFLPLPYGSLFSSGDNLTFGYQTGAGLTLFYTNPSSVAPPSTIYANVFVVPPAVMKQHPNTNWNDYNQVSAIMNDKNLSK